jgi:hypothetical protein
MQSRIEYTKAREENQEDYSDSIRECGVKNAIGVGGKNSTGHAKCLGMADSHYDIGGGSLLLAPPDLDGDRSSRDIGGGSLLLAPPDLAGERSSRVPFVCAETLDLAA